MSRAPLKIATIADEVLAEVEAGERRKLAEIEAVKAATPRHAGEVSRLLAKVAEELRAPAPDVTYDDVTQFLGGLS